MICFVFCFDIGAIPNVVLISHFRDKNEDDEDTFSEEEMENSEEYTTSDEVGTWDLIYAL